MDERHDEWSDTMVRVFVKGDRTAEFPKMPSPQQEFLDVVAMEFWRVRDAHESLENTESHLRHPPLFNIKPSAFLRYHIEHWFHSLYVIRERTVAYLRGVTKFYKGTATEPELRSLTTDAGAHFDNVFSGSLSLRGHIVHVGPLPLPDLANLQIIEDVSEMNPESAKRLPMRRYPEVVKEWVGVLNESNKVVDSVLDDILGDLHPLVFDGEQPRYPEQRRSA
jgi:hypothetical protein